MSNNRERYDRIKPYY